MITKVRYTHTARVQVKQQFPYLPSNKITTKYFNFFFFLQYKQVRIYTCVSVYNVAGSRESRGSRDSASIEVLSAPTSPSDNQNSSHIGRNPLRGSKCNLP